jgi:acid phosphatase (class A)
MKPSIHGFSIAFCVALLCSCATQRSSQPTPVPEFKPGRLMGYLSIDEQLNSSAILPAPPRPGSFETASDDAISRAALRLRDTARWKLATSDANLSFPEAAGIYSCALNAPISAQDTPYLYQILRRAASDAGYAVEGAKDLYKRNRPFVINRQPPCTPDEMNSLGTDRSYPSGHSSIGTVWALILTELAPDRVVSLLTRGQTYAESRIVCNMHWQSDTIQGRFVGAYTYSRLQANPEFKSDMRAAREELSAVRARKPPLTRDCKAEAEAIENSAAALRFAE